MSNVYVIFGVGFSLEEIKKDLQEEGYSHNFFFSYGKERDVWKRALEISQEVWVFGKVDGYEDYEMAKAMQKDIWIMG